MKISQYIDSFEQCQNIFKNFKKDLIAKQFCAMHYGGFICQGSSGG